MSKWQKIAIVLGAFLVIATLALAGLGAWLFTGGAGSSVLASMSQPTALRNATLLPGATPTPNESAQSNLTATATRKSATAESLPKKNSTQAQARGKRQQLQRAAFGTVSQVAGSSLTIASPTGDSQTVQVGRKTRLVLVGKLEAKVSDIKPGDKILVLGSNNNKKSAESRALLVVPSSYEQQNIVAGKIERASPGELTLKSKEGSVTVSLASETPIFRLGLRPSPDAELHEGRFAVVMGVRASDGTLTAQVVLAKLGEKADRTLRTPSRQATRTPTP